MNAAKFSRIWFCSLRLLALSVLMLPVGGVLAQAPKNEPDKPKEPPKKGVVLDDQRAQQGYTLIAPLMSNKT
jgi:hypothetical protein